MLNCSRSYFVPAAPPISVSGPLTTSSPFRPALTFVKSGYITHSRKLAVAVGKPRSISVAMKKAPPARRAFFGR